MSERDPEWRFDECCIRQREMTADELADHTPCRYPYCLGWKFTDRQVAVLRKLREAT